MTKLKNGIRYPDHLKRQIVKEVLEGKESLEYYRFKYKIGGSTTISRWIGKFAGGKSKSTHDMSKQKQENNELDLLRAKVTLLERELEHERLRRQAFEIMIEVAENELNIPIKKKSGAKPSKK